ncbi:MAG: hypothetical protein WBX22_01170 [Silvibacterium sp.]
MRKGYRGCLRIATLTILPSALITGVQALPQAKSHSAESDPCCSIVVQALRDYGHLKVGIKRSEVEKDFQVSGGLSTRTEAYYVYKRCQIIQVDIKFSPSPTSKDSPPDDVVSSFSQLVVKEQPAD